MIYYYCRCRGVDTGRKAITEMRSCNVGFIFVTKTGIRCGMGLILLCGLHRKLQVDIDTLVASVCGHVRGDVPIKLCGKEFAYFLQVLL